jgi:lauroyl/myristoyl acyltransferase
MESKNLSNVEINLQQESLRQAYFTNVLFESASSCSLRGALQLLSSGHQQSMLPSHHLLMVQSFSFLYFFNNQQIENTGQAALPSKHQYTSYPRHTYRNLSFCLHIPP